MGIGGSWGGIPSDRVVAVVACLQTERVQIGSGYLITDHLVLTARHCTVDKRTGRAARSLRVVRRSDGAEASATPCAAASDVAILTVGGDPAWPVSAVLEPPRFGRVDRSRSRELRGCEAVGFPLWQLDPQDQQRNAAELHGTIRVTEDIESGLLVMRDPLLQDVAIPRTAVADDRAEGSPWGGLSGALVFYHGIALGVVIEHHPRQGRSAITILPVERLAAIPADGDVDSLAVAAVLGLPSAEKLPLAGGRPVAELVEISVHGRLPRVADLDPYTLGATPSMYGNAETYGQRDEYVPRANDEPLARALVPGRLVMLVGPSKAGKTRTAFEVVRGHGDWGDALLGAPAPQSLDHLAGHPALGSSEPLVIWLDDLPRFLPPTGGLSQATISRLADRPGPTVLLATLRAEQRELLRGAEGELTREVRVVLDRASSIELGSTREDPDEQARAAEVYPPVGFRPEGLAEILAGAPELLRRYRDAAAADPPLHMLVQICVDWSRCGLARPVSEADLLAFARDALEENRPDLDFRNDEMDEALRRARRAIAGRGQVALLHTHRLPERDRGYLAFDYLEAVDDGQDGERARPVAESTWRCFLDRGTEEDAFYIGVAAFQRDNIAVAVAAGRRAAEAGDANAQEFLGGLLLYRLDPPELAEARAWLTKAAQAGHADAQVHLGLLLQDRDPPELAEARTWFTKAAQAGHTFAQACLGLLLQDLDPPELAEARTWYTKAADAGYVDVQVNLGVLLVSRLDPPELAEARTWFTKAAEAGNTDAQVNLGRLLASGLDPPELAEARIWWTRAAEAGETSAQYFLGWLLENPDSPELAEARTWYTKAAEAGYTDAQVNLGRLLATGLDPPELAEARTWLTRAAEAGNTDAQVNLGGLLEDLDPPELAEARFWYTRAAEAGNTDAQYVLGWLLEDLDPPELAEARFWYTRAAEAGHIDAQYRLGVLLATRLDPPELAEARSWWTRAAEAGDTNALAALQR